MNLIRNGVESHESGAIINVRTTVGDDHVRIFVEDNGRGLSPGDHERIFEPFFTTRQSLGGSGLGLSVVRGIVEDHDGSIRAYPVPDADGTIFEIELPVQSGHDGH